MLLLLTLRYSWRTVYLWSLPAFIIDLLFFPPLPYWMYLAGVSCERYNYGHSDGLGTFDHLRYGNYPFVFMVAGLVVTVLFMWLEMAMVIELQRNPPKKNSDE